MNLPTFNYKVNKTTTFGIIDKEGVFEKTLDKNFEIQIGDKKWEIDLNNKENKDLYYEKPKEFISLLEELQNLFQDVFKKENYHNFSFNYDFKKQEKKKLETKNLSDKALNSKIWKKYLGVFRNLKNNIENLKELMNTEEENLARITEIVKTIRYIKGNLEGLFSFIQAYQYFGGEENKKKALNILKNKTTKDKITKDKITKDKITKDKIIELLEFYSKKDTNQFLIYKIALNPAILNTHKEVSEEIFKHEIEKLEKEINELDEKNEENKKTKRFFEEELNAFLTYILYNRTTIKNKKKEPFFRKGEGRTKIYINELGEKFDNYFKYSESIFKKYTNFIKNKEGNNLKYYEKLVLDFINKNGLKGYIDFENEKVNNKKWIELEYDYIEKLLNQEIKLQNFEKKIKEEMEIDKNGKNINIPKYNYLQLITLQYKLSWEKAELKEQEKDYQNISEYLRVVKGEIQTRLKNKKALYGKFISPEGYKAKTAQKLGQKYGEYLQKANYQKEILVYTHFGFIIRKGERYFILPYKKEDLLKDGKGFTINDAKKLLKDFEEGEDKVYLFESLTLKALNKLIFIKNAFEKDFYNEYKEIKNIWKQKKYLEREKNYKWKENLQKLIGFYLEILNSDKAKKLFPFLDYDFKKAEEYKSLADFEKDLLKNAYKIEIFNKNIPEEKLIELDIVDRSFEYDNTKNPRLKRQKDIKLFAKGFFENIENYQQNGFDKIRLLPEINLFVRYKLMDGQPKKEKRGKKEVETKKRFYKDVYKASFLFELNPLGIGQNPKCEQEKFLEKLKQQDLHYIGIDVGQKELITLAVYKKDKNGKLVPQEIEINGKKEKFLDLTDLKIDNGKIVKTNNKISEKFKAIKYMFKQILLGQIYLKDILKEIGEVEVKKENFGNIKAKISEKVNKIEEIKSWDSNEFNEIKKFFPNLRGNLSYIIFEYIKENIGNKINFKDKKHYNAIFDKLQLAKAVNLKDAFSSNFIGVIKKILEQYPGILIFEALHTGKTYNAKDEIPKIRKDDLTKIEAQLIRDFNTYFFPYLFKSLFNHFTKVIEYEDKGIDIKQYVYLDKNYENSIEKGSNKKYGYNGIIYWVDEAYTSSACPVCNDKLYKVEKENINKLHGHLKGEKWEKNMHHCDNPKNCPGVENHISKENRANCDYHMGKNTYGFEFKNGDQLATYNIAKRGYEYFTSLNK